MALISLSGYSNPKRRPIAYKARDAALDRLGEHGIHTTFHYLPLHLSEMGKRVADAKNQCPVTVDISERIIRLPFYTELSIEDQQYVIEKICTLDI